MAKRPKTNIKTTDKEVRKVVPDADHAEPVWSFSLITLGGRWCWSLIDPEDRIKVLECFKAWEQMSWIQLKTGGHNYVLWDKLCNEAQDILKTLGHEGTDTLFEFKPEGMGIKRVFGIRDRQVFKIIWWDPLHEVCPWHGKGNKRL